LFRGRWRGLLFSSLPLRGRWRGLLLKTKAPTGKPERAFALTLLSFILLACSFYLLAETYYKGRTNL